MARLNPVSFRCKQDLGEFVPSTLSRSRAFGSTQSFRQAQARLGVKAQQIQRYDASDYQTVSFARLREIARLLGLRIRESVELVQN